MSSQQFVRIKDLVNLNEEPLKIDPDVGFDSSLINIGLTRPASTNNLAQKSFKCFSPISSTTENRGTFSQMIDLKLKKANEKQELIGRMTQHCRVHRSRTQRE
jgi:hypothetical protein